jgi:CheY-like chemotaxis protein
VSSTLKGTRLLVVEDDMIICIMIESFLAKLGCEVAAVSVSLQDALLKAKTLAIDAAVLDVNLNGEMTFPVAEALEARSIPFFFATSYAAKELPTRLVGVPVLRKPFGMPQLAAALRLAMKKI